MIIVETDDKNEGVGSSEEEQENSGGETDQVQEIDPRAEDRELKNHLLKKYSGYLSSLKQELSKKKKKGKLPKEARQKLLNWWELHYKWPYPSVSSICPKTDESGIDQIHRFFGESEKYNIFSFFRNDGYIIVGFMITRNRRRWHWLNQQVWIKSK